ncbi:MAG: CDF family Co(II)/Ni(II) efflux transporter DmeF, partial [Bdellovibrionales bacterium]|nr:CDF family Co(II)/Ni(II) efflux transporter DmeF [Bdellovibrionales bacterium]
MLTQDHHHDYLTMDTQITKNERKTFFVVVLTVCMMVIEIISGYYTGSMALLADGWHMASHAGALSISLIAYRLAKSDRLTSKFSFGTGKFIPLGGYTSAIVLAMIALLMGIESVSRFFSPVEIQFKEAILVAVVGLIVNVISALLLSHDDHGHTHAHSHDGKHHDHRDHHDHNIRSAYVHVIADALTSVLAIFALIVGLFSGASWLDPAMGIVGSCVILKWAYNLCRDTGWELLDGHAKSVDRDHLRRTLEDTGAEVLDLHIWKIAPSINACAIVLES